jgi:hypothetical protein
VKASVGAELNIALFGEVVGVCVHNNVAGNTGCLRWV